MHWLKATSVRGAAESKVSELSKRINDRRSVASGRYEHEMIVKAVREPITAGLALQKEWFCDSVGITWEEGEEETWYISRAPLANNIASDHMVHWTRWLGRLSTQIREYLALGFPTSWR
jgi:hypothetical protein